MKSIHSSHPQFDKAWLARNYALIAHNYTNVHLSTDISDLIIIIIAMLTSKTLENSPNNLKNNALERFSN